MSVPPTPHPVLRALVVDDEQPALSELTYLLGKDPRIGSIQTASSGAEALRALEEGEGNVDVLFCDVRMPGLDGLDLARVLARFSHRPQIVFVTAYERHAIDAFDLRATDYVMKPVRPQRLAEAVKRVVENHSDTRSQRTDPGDDETIAVELAGVTRFVQRSQVRYVEAHGDYARLHTSSSNHLIRIPLTTLEERWAAAGFIRIHRSTLVALAHIDEIRVDGGRCSVRLGERVLQVSRRHTKELRDRLVRSASLSKGDR